MSCDESADPSLAELGYAPTDAQLRFIEAIEGAFSQDGAVFCGSTKRDAAAFIKEWAPRMRPFGGAHDPKSLKESPTPLSAPTRRPRSGRSDGRQCRKPLARARIGKRKWEEVGKLDTCMKTRHVYSKKIRWNGHYGFWFQRTGRCESGPKAGDNRQMSIIFYMISRQVYLDFFVHSAQNPPKTLRKPRKTPQKLQRTPDNPCFSPLFVNCSTHMFHV